MNQNKIQQFPISPFLDQISDSLHNTPGRALVLTAETGAGKSTILPLSILEKFDGKILMTEPRRLAVLGVANRVSDLLDEQCGNTVGYRIQLETKKSASTRLEVVTEAILVRELQNDPALEKYNVVVLDEFHERSVNLDLALAFLKEAMELRDDLYVVVMSATIDARKIAGYLGEGTPVVEVPGRTFPVHFEYKPTKTIVSAIQYAFDNYDGNILVFLPGIYEIRKCEGELREALTDEDVEIHVLHSSVNFEDQKKILTPSAATRRIIISSAIAETSLTIPGIRVVIDSGLSRINRLNIATGMENLVTERESEFSAKQRAGRAGREQEGYCIRLWEEKNPLPKELAPEILRTDLASVVLECSERGIFSVQNIDWLDKPSEAAWKTSCELLQILGCVKEDGHILPKGKAVLRMGISTRLACIALSECSWNRKADLILKYSTYAKSDKGTQKRFLEKVEGSLPAGSSPSSAAGAEPGGRFSVDSPQPSAGRICLEGFPDRLGKRVSVPGVQPCEYQFASGRKAFAEKGPEWIVAVEVSAGSVEGKIFEYEEISEQEVQQFLEGKTRTVEECYFDNGKILKYENEVLGRLVINQKKINSTPQDYAKAWVGEVQRKGLEVLPSDKKLESFLQRVSFYNQQKNCEGKDLVATVDEWLVPFVTGGNLTAGTVYEALYWYLEGAVIDKEVPELIILPNGSRAKVKYEMQTLAGATDKLVIRPVIEIIIQRIFGCFETPKILGMNVLLKLLSPASRPLQITDDLENFWTGAWIEICKEMKGRYPKHNWDYRVFNED